MTDLTLAAAQTIVSAALDYAASKGMKPLAVVVLDARASDKALAAQDGCPIKRPSIARAKANGAVSVGMGSRSLSKLAVDRPHFTTGLGHIVGDAGMIPVPGGVLILDGDGKIIGAVGVSGDTSDNDEHAAMAGIAAAGFKGNPGVD